MAGAYVAAIMLASSSSSSFSSSTTTSTSTYASTGLSNDAFMALALVGSIIYFSGVVITFFQYSDSQARRTAKEDEWEKFPRTKLVWEIIKMLLWPVGLLWWIIIGMIVEEWCKPVWKWLRANKKEEWWCTCAGVNAWTCDVCCFRNCRDACDVLFRGREGGYRGVNADWESQTAQNEGVVDNQPSTTGSMELPTYDQATDATNPTWS